MNAGTAERPARGRRLRRAGLVCAVFVAMLAVGELVLRLPRWIVRSPFDESVAGRLRNDAEAWPELVPFDVTAAPSQLRIVYMGASTEAGLPYGPKLSPPAWLDQILRWRGVQAEVVQFAGPGLTSRQMRDLFPFALRMEPNVIVLAVGHNEYLHSGELLDRRWWARSELLRRGLATLGVTDALAETLPTIENDFDHAAIQRNFREHLRTMQRAADGADVKLLVLLPASNLAHSPPILGDDPRLPEEPDAAWRRGAQLLDAGDVVGARAAFEQARDTDRWPHRATGALLSILREEARQVVPVDRAMEIASVRGVPGFDLFADHCHPNPAGQRVMTLAVADAIEDLGLFPLTGRRGQGPSVDEMLASAGYGPADLARAHAVIGRGYVGFALVTGRWGALAELAQRSLDSAYQDLDAYGGELDTSYALIALLRGDVAEGLRHLEQARTNAPEALLLLERACRVYPWVRQVFERNGLQLREGTVVAWPDAAADVRSGS
ncbi:MAG: hypothetical protein ACT4PU_10615 [Planctomycetota bacterium]